jgi:D-3-phosphoglycerate dehydrogenase
MKILVSERIAQDGVDLLINKYGKENVDVNYDLATDFEGLKSIIGNYDALVVRSTTPVNAELLSNPGNLKVVGRAGNGIDNIDVEAATNKGIIVVNTPEGNIMAAAELTIGHMFGICRSITLANNAAKAGDFRRNKFKGIEVFEKTLGIIGLGRIGSLVATRMKGCGMNVIAYDPYIPDERYEKLGVTKMETLEELLKEADIITIHTPKTQETYNILGKEQFELMKDGVRIVNCARGGLINEDALYENVKSGKVAGAAIDVFDKEPSYELEKQDFHRNLLECPNVMITPHLGASTSEAQYNVGVSVAKHVIGALNGEMVSSAVNLPTMPKEKLEELKPYLKLAESMGKMYFQTEKYPVSKIEIIYSGDIIQKETSMVTLAFLKGFLEPVVKEVVNYVNAEVFAKSRNIEVVESKNEKCEHYSNLITVKFISKEKERALAGTVFSNESIKLVEFYGYNVDCTPEKYVLAVQNNDVPGVIGKIGTELGKAGVNIAGMQVSRNKRGQNAVMLINIDSNIEPDVMKEINSLEGVRKASIIKF